MKAREKAEKYAKEHPMSCEEDDECTQIIMNDYLAGYQEALKDAAEAVREGIPYYGEQFDVERAAAEMSATILALGEE